MRRATTFEVQALEHLVFFVTTEVDHMIDWTGGRSRVELHLKHGLVDLVKVSWTEVKKRYQPGNARSQNLQPQLQSPVLDRFSYFG